MLFPKNNLPTASSPWGREVEDQIKTLKNIVEKNSINNFANSATDQTNIKNINAVLADQLELVTYSTELDLDSGNEATFTSSTGSFTADTSKLDININLNKARKLLINYSSYCIAQVEFLTATGANYYGFTATIFVDGIAVDYQTVAKYKYKNVVNDFIQDLGSINVTKLIPVSAGSHIISVRMDYYAITPSPASTLMATSGDNLIVSVVQ